MTDNYLNNYYRGEHLARLSAVMIITELTRLIQDPAFDDKDSVFVFEMVWKFMDLNGMCMTLDFAKACPRPQPPTGLSEHDSS
jgi:hypothetical protein